MSVSNQKPSEQVRELFIQHLQNSFVLSTVLSTFFLVFQYIGNNISLLFCFVRYTVELYKVTPEYCEYFTQRFSCTTLIMDKQ